MPGHDLICVGGSAGSVEATLRLAEALPADLPAAVLLAIHVPRNSSSNLPKLLEARGRMRARFAQDGEAPQRGVIHVAQADRHLVVADGVLRLSRGPHENGYRPSIDTMFRSAAISAGPRVVGVVLSGNLDDGTVGLISVRRAGGIAVVQDPKDAAYPDMPRNAIRGAGADHVVKLASLPALLVRLAAEPAGVPAASPAPGGLEVGYSPFVCPDCGGVLDVEEGELPSFKCQVGHRWNGKALASKQSEELELALWAALRTLLEHVRLSRTLERRSLARGHPTSAARFANRAKESEHRLKLVRRALGLSHPRRRTHLEREPPGERDVAAAFGGSLLDEEGAEGPLPDVTDGDGDGPLKG